MCDGGGFGNSCVMDFGVVGWERFFGAVLRWARLRTKSNISRFAPAFGRAVAASRRWFLARLKACPSGFGLPRIHVASFGKAIALPCNGPFVT